MHCIGNLGNSCEFRRHSLEKPAEFDHNSHKRPKRPNYDGSLWVFPRKVVRIRMTSRNCLYNAPGKEVSNFLSFHLPLCGQFRDRGCFSDTSLLRAMGFLVSQHCQLGAIPSPPFLSVSPLESMRSGGAIPPPPNTKGVYLSDADAIPYENKENACDTPFCDASSQGYCAIWGGSSHWATKLGCFSVLSRGSGCSQSNAFSEPLLTPVVEAVGTGALKKRRPSYVRFGSTCVCVLVRSPPTI